MRFKLLLIMRIISRVIIVLLSLLITSIKHCYATERVHLSSAIVISFEYERNVPRGNKMHRVFYWILPSIEDELIYPIHLPLNDTIDGYNEAFVIDSSNEINGWAISDIETLSKEFCSLDAQSFISMVNANRLPILNIKKKWKKRGVPSGYDTYFKRQKENINIYFTCVSGSFLCAKKIYITDPLSLITEYALCPTGDLQTSQIQIDKIEDVPFIKKLFTFEFCNGIPDYNSEDNTSFDIVRCAKNNKVSDGCLDKSVVITIDNGKNNLYYLRPDSSHPYVYSFDNSAYNVGLARRQRRKAQSIVITSLISNEILNKTNIYISPISGSFCITSIGLATVLSIDNSCSNHLSLLDYYANYSFITPVD